jgi:hypothetical protein
VLNTAAAVVPFVPGGAGAAIKAGRGVEKAVDAALATEKGVSAVQRGRQTEKAVLQTEGLAKNTRAIQVVDPKTGKIGKTIPDAIRRNGQTVEIKDVQHLRDSAQLRRQTVISRASGQEAQVILSDRNRSVSRTVRERMQVRHASKKTD